MENEQASETPNLPPTPAVTNAQGKKFSKKAIVITAVLLLTLLTGVIIFLSIKPAKKEIPKISAPATTQIGKEEIKEIAREISIYIKSQKRPDGFYNYVSHFEEQCPSESSSKDCPFGGINMFETTNTWGALGLYSASKILDDSSLLDEALTDLKNLQAYCEKDRKQCNRILIQPSIIYNTVKGTELRQFLTLQSKELLSSPATSNPMLSAIEARENVKLNGITNDPQHLIVAQRRLLESSSLLQKSTQNIYFSSKTHFKVGSCWLALASIENALATDKKFSNTITFLENGKLRENFSQIMVPSEIQPCIESYILLYNSTNDPVHLEKAQGLMKLFIQTFYDGPRNKKIYGEGGTKFSNAIEDEASEKIVTLTDSAYTLYLLNLLYEYEN
ncbi:MAG: hypothetical protein Q7T54_00575 [Candidatus Levybacteria bacterium]|nr:hypothetical protein [Candidatus Levybacteria bacterium]